MNKLLVIGNDKIGRNLITVLPSRKDIFIAIDISTSLERVFKLLLKQRIDIKLLLKLFWAETIRDNYILNLSYKKVSSNSDLLDIVQSFSIEKIYLFRAGLIINKTLLNSGIKIFNIHCASLPEYRGLGAISKALQDGVYKQEATLHRVTDKIDQGEVIATMPYIMNENHPYYVNENIAYEAGIKLLIRSISE